MFRIKFFWVLCVAFAFSSAPLGAQTLVKMTIATGVDPAFSQFYVAKEAGIFAKNGLDVSINTGPSGSAMVPFLINNQVQAAYGSDMAGVINHNLDNNVVVVADGTYLKRWMSILGKNINDLEGLKGKKIGIAKGTASELFWSRLLEKKNLKAADYKIVDVEAPEMLAAIERGDIDAFSVWEPWPTRTLFAIKGTKILQDADGILNNINFIYMNKSWIESNRETAENFMRSLVEANDLINKDRPAAAKMVSKFLKMPIELTTELMPKVEYEVVLNDRSVATIKVAEDLLAQQKKLKAPLNYSNYIYSDLLKKVRPENITMTTQAPK